MIVSNSASPSANLPRKMAISLWIFLGASVCFLLLTKLVHQSFFFDGGIYASAARNLAEGVGSLWSPHFSKTLFPVFAEHPPLMIWLEALGFSIFGDYIAVEKGFSLLTFAVSGLILFKLWLRLHADDVVMQSAAPIALFMTLIAGRVNWAFANGMLENLLIVFTLCAVFLIVAAYDEKYIRFPARRVTFIAIAGAFICFGVLTKGPVALFPLAAPAICWVTLRRPSLNLIIIDSLILLAIVAVFFGVLWCFHAPQQAIQRYLEGQLLSSLSGNRGHEGGGLSVLRRVVSVNGYSLSVLVIFLLTAGIRAQTATASVEVTRLRWRRGAFLLLVACSASLPMMISPRTFSFYFNTSIVYFSPGFSVFYAPVVMNYLRRVDISWQNHLTVLSSVFLLFSISIVALNFGRPGVDRQTITNAAEIAKIVCRGGNCAETVGACDKVFVDWALHAYMQRYYKVSVARMDAGAQQYLIADETCTVDPSYKETAIDLVPYRLLER